MKKILISVLLILSLAMSAALVSCVDDKDYDDYEEHQTNATEKAPLPTDPEETEEDEVLGVGADTDDSWGEIQSALQNYSLNMEDAL